MATWLPQFHFWRSFDRAIRRWQVNCSYDHQSVNIKTKIRYKDQEYSDPNQLPPEARAAYEKAMAGKAPIKKKVVINGEEFSDEPGMPDDARRLYADIMSVVQNNGHVTLPGVSFSEGLLTKRQVCAIVSVLGALGMVALLIIARRVG
jgi:hypothetical protein